jgi:hypothetical protein
MHKTKREIADELLHEMFENSERVSIAEVVAEGKRRDVSRRTLLRAKQALGVIEIHNGPYPAFWQRP